jgi:hypothetical protein
MRKQPIVHADTVRLTGGPMDGALVWDRTRGGRQSRGSKDFVLSLPVDHPKVKDYFAVTYSRATGRVTGYVRRPRPAGGVISLG